LIPIIAGCVAGMHVRYGPASDHRGKPGGASAQTGRPVPDGCIDAVTHYICGQKGF